MQIWNVTNGNNKIELSDCQKVNKQQKHGLARKEVEQFDLRQHSLLSAFEQMAAKCIDSPPSSTIKPQTSLLSELCVHLIEAQAGTVRQMWSWLKGIHFVAMAHVSLYIFAKCV